MNTPKDAAAKRRRHAAPLDLTQADNRLRQRFWSKVDIRSSDECWTWTAHRKATGYGQFVLRKGVFITASRASLAMVTPLAAGEVACHRCDNPPCVNPRHLFKGTQSDNGLDASRKGRLRMPRGEASPFSKLTVEQVREIRSHDKRYGLTAELARQYGVGEATIRNIRAGKKWADVA